MYFANAKSNCTFADATGKSFSSCAFSLIITLVGAAVAAAAFLFASIISVRGIIVLSLLALLAIIIVRIVRIVSVENTGFLRKYNQ